MIQTDEISAACAIPAIDFPSDLMEESKFNGVVSLYDMLRFMAENFWKSCQILTEWGASAGIGLHLPPSKTIEAMQALSKLQQNVRELGLPVSAQELMKLNLSMGNAVRDIERLPKERQKAEFDRVSAEIRLRLDNVSSVIHSELSQRLLYVSRAE